MKKYIKNNTPLAYSDAVVLGNTIYLAGQGPNNIGVSPEEQVRQTIGNIERLLINEGFSIQDVIKVTVILNYSVVTPQLFEPVYKEFFHEPYPVRTIFSSEIGFNVQIDVIAVKE
jgi:2-iminobutanoate/2-iminopropanoate deaminase